MLKTFKARCTVDMCDGNGITSEIIFIKYKEDDYRELNRMAKHWWDQFHPCANFKGIAKYKELTKN